MKKACIFFWLLHMYIGDRGGTVVKVLRYKSEGRWFELHRITECGEGSIIWNWTRHKIGLILRTDQKHIPRAWTIRPDFHHWPEQKHTAILWLIATLVQYRLQKHRRLSLTDYMDFLQRSRWKLYQRSSGRRPTGRYLELLNSP
jgi:hypothetical protein